MKTKALVIDLDDTLYSELDFLKSAYLDIASKLDDENQDLLYCEMISLYYDNKDVFQVLENKYGVSKSILLDWYRFHFPKITLFENVKEVLDLLSKEFLFAIITDGRSVTQRNKIKALGLEDYMFKIVISEEINSTKPNEKNFLEIEKKLKCKYYIYIGDNPKKDFITPNRLGWDTICLKNNGCNVHAQNFDLDLEYLPKYIISNWLELVKIISVENKD